MTEKFKITVPNIGDFEDVPVIEVLVSAGDAIEAEQPLITLESDKATMDVPAPRAGTLESLQIGVGDRVSTGSVIGTLVLSDSDAQAGADTDPQTDAENATEPASRSNDDTEQPHHDTETQAGDAPTAGKADRHAQVVVIGGGPGGYTAAFRAADLGLDTLLIERYPELGGVCLNVGCIPSKALLHAGKVITEAREMSNRGVVFAPPKIELGALRAWKNSVVQRLTRGLAGLAKKRKVDVLQGSAEFVDPHRLAVNTPDGVISVSFDHVIVAAGSRPLGLPDLPQDPRVIDSTGALALSEIPKRMLVIGGGIIGLEMAAIYHELGARVTVVELTSGLLPGVDRDIVKPLSKRIDGLYENVFVGTKITAVDATDNAIRVSFDGPEAPEADVFDRVLVAVGRCPNSHDIGAENAGIETDAQGYIIVDEQQRTNVDRIFAIGDIAGPPMLAHKATHEGKVAAEVCAGLKSGFEAAVIPSVAYTDPEVAWVGVTETEAKERGLDYGTGTFPWAASGRALGLGREEGITKLLFDTKSNRLIGAGIVGPSAGDLIAEAALAIEMGSDAEDIGLTVHPHPTLSETLAFSAEAYAGTITDLYIPKRS